MDGYQQPKIRGRGVSGRKSSMCKSPGGKALGTFKEWQGGLCGRNAERGLRRRREVGRGHATEGLKGPPGAGFSLASNGKPLEGREQQERSETEIRVL